MSLAAKRPFLDEANKVQSPEPKRVPAMSFAAKLNAKTMQQLQKAFEADPEVDLTTVFPTNYSSRLASRKTNKENGESISSEASGDTDPTEANGYPPIIIPTSPATIIHPLSETVQTLLNVRTDKISSIKSIELTKALAQILRNSDFLWQTQYTRERYVAKCGPDVVVKSIGSSSDFTEYTSLQYLELHRPHIPAPRPHGLITAGKSAYLFMTFLPGDTLHKVWPQLQESQKESLSKDLGAIFSDIRQLQRPNKMALGGVAGEGCKDTRRHTRISPVPLYTSSDFWDF